MDHILYKNIRVHNGRKNIMLILKPYLTFGVDTSCLLSDIFYSPDSSF